MVGELVDGRTGRIGLVGDRMKDARRGEPKRACSLPDEQRAYSVQHSTDSLVRRVVGLVTGEIG